MKIRLAILEEDKTYINRLTSTLNVKYADNFEIYSFTSESAAYEILAGNKIDIFLASDSFNIDKQNVPSRCGFAYLVESAGIESLRNERVIHKFQKAELIYKNILSIFSECATEITGISMDANAKCQTIAFLSASGGTGASSVAAACALNFAKKGKKVLYFNLERFGSADVFFEGQGNGNFGDIIYAIKSKKGNLALKLESTVKKSSSGVFFYSATNIALDMAELSSDEVRNIITTIKMFGGYEYIVIDMDFSLEKSEVDIWQECNQIVFVNDGSPTSNIKLDRVITSMKILEEQNDWKLLGRCNTLYNRFSSKTSEMIVIPDIKNIGGIKRYEGYAMEQLLEQLAQNDVFTELL